MNIKPLIVQPYLESLTEDMELNRIFPLLLTSLGFEILSKPTENKGLAEYGKDIVAVGKDDDGIKKRFYFELKGGKDKDVTTSTLNKKDGIIESLREAKFKKFTTTYKGFSSLPLKIILVHNGILKGNVRDVFNGFIEQEFPLDGENEFERWGIEKLTDLFANRFFSAYLLTDQQTTKLFNKVLINLNTTSEVLTDFKDLLDLLFEKEKWEGYKRKLQRKWELLFATLKLISLIIYTEAREYNNFDISKRYLTHLVIRFWSWILKNKLERDKKVVKYFFDVFDFFYDTLIEYFQRTIHIATLPNGLSSEISGKYEQVGYTKRTFEYLSYLCFLFNVSSHYEDVTSKKSLVHNLTRILNQNSVSSRPLIDINSTPIIGILNFYISINDIQTAKVYLREVLSYVINGKEQYNRMPDANNSYKSVIRFILTKEKPAYYSDKTSLLLGVLIEYITILDMPKEYKRLREFLIKNEIDIGIFVPHHRNNYCSLLIKDRERDLDEQLFSNPYFNEGYQYDIRLFKELHQDLSFKDFNAEFAKRKDEFNYEYRTDKAGFPFLKDLAHIYFNTPYFPGRWRRIEIEKSPENAI